MNVLHLYESKPDIPPKRPWVLWRGRDAPDGISLEKMLDDHLVQIRNEHMRWACDIATLETFGKQNIEQALAGGEALSMWWLSLVYERHPRLSPWLYPVYKLRCLELLLEQWNCRKLVFIGNDRGLEEPVKNLCLSKNIEFDKINSHDSLQSQKPRLTERLYTLAPAPLRALVRLAHWFWKIKSKLPAVSGLPSSRSRQKTAVIVSYFPNIDIKVAEEGRFVSHYWENLHEALNAEAKKEFPDGGHFCRWLFIRFPSPDLSLNECIKFCKNFEKNGQDGLSFNYLEEFLDFRGICKAVMRWAKISFASYLAQKDFSHACHFHASGLNFWNFARYQWGESFRGWRCLERCLQSEAFRRFYKMAGAQRWTLFALENCPWERMLTGQARQLAENGPVFGAQHSTIRPTDFRYFDDPATFGNCGLGRFQPDIIGGNGNSACRQWLANGMPERCLRELEALRYLYLADSFAKTEKLSGKGARKRMLVLTSFFKDETAAHLRLVQEAMDANLLIDYDIVIKSHPYLPIDNWLNSLPALQRQAITITKQPLAQELKPGVCVWASNSTTASLEAAYRGLPLMVMRSNNDFDLCPVQDIPGLLRTGSINETREALANIAPINLPSGYLDLDPCLPAWRKLLKLA